METNTVEYADMPDTATITTGAFVLTDPFPTRTKSKVCIVGFADGHRASAPFDDPDMEMWGINRLHAVLPDKTWDRWFEIHDLEKFYADDAEHQTFLKNAKFPVYIRRQDHRVAKEWGLNAEAFPHTELVDRFAPYFTNTVSWLIALAIVMDFEEIHIYGVDMAQDTLQHAEYRQQRPSCEWLIGYAQGKGITVVMPPGSDLLKASHLYGFDSPQHLEKLQARMGELGQRKETVRAEMRQHTDRATWLQSRISELDGSMQELEYQTTNLITRIPVVSVD